MMLGNPIRHSCQNRLRKTRPTPELEPLVVVHKAATTISDYQST
jgi:hypothetical protein